MYKRYSELSDLMKMQKIGHVLSVVILIGIVFAVLGSAMLVSLGIISVFDQDLMNSMMEVFGNDVNQVYVGLTMSSVILITCTIILAFAYRLFKDIGKEYTPFTSKNVKTLRLIGHLLLISAVGLPVLNCILVALFVPGGTVDVLGNIVLLLMAVIFYCVSLIFGYGVALQKESDETL